MTSGALFIAAEGERQDGGKGGRRRNYTTSNSVIKKNGHTNQMKNIVTEYKRVHIKTLKNGFSTWQSHSAELLLIV